MLNNNKLHWSPASSIFEKLKAMLTRHRGIPYNVFDGIEEKYGITRKELRDCLVENWDTCAFYADLCDKVQDLFPKNTNSWTEQERRALGKWQCTFYKQKVYDVIRDYFVADHGKKRSLKDAARMAADFWIKAIFDNTLQCNGDTNWHSEVINYISSEMKARALEKYTDPSIKESIRSRIARYYIKAHYKTLVVDYTPQRDLSEILVDGGINESDADTIAPIKTMCMLDVYDNSVVIVRPEQTIRL